MLDSIALFTKDFELKPSNRFLTKTLTAISTGEVTSETTFCNLSGAQFSIKPQGSEKSLFFQTSLPKLLYGTSLKELQRGDFEQSLEAIEEKFKEAGVYIEPHSLASFGVSRVDYCRNIEVTHNIYDYLAILRNCSLGGRTKTTWQTQTVTFFNKSQELCAYNKVLEVKQDAIQALAAGVTPETPENILRLEKRLKKAKVVQSILKRRTFSECFDFELAKKKLLEDFDKTVMNVGQQLELNLNFMDELLSEHRSLGRDGLGQIEKRFGRDYILLLFQEDMELLKAWLFRHYERRQAYYHLANYRRHLAERRTPEQRDLLGELRAKLAA